ncbi:MAG: cation:proton antiporter, partial [Lachnospiraceae bacterium]|nr:cation:proton antiporter [Lachnospiraceae bacterium]
MRLATLSEHEIVITLIGLALLLLAAFVFGSLMELIKGPRVVGEILGGMILGGSCLFLLFPGLSEKIFFAYAEEGKVLNIFYQLGLIFLMFLSGYNTDIKVDKSNAKTISLVFVGATFLPMLGSIPFFGMFEEYFKGPAGNEVSYKLVFAIGVAITSIPVISKIFFDMGIMNKAFSNTVLTVSTFQDLCLWILLNVATRIAQSGEIKLVEMIVIVIVTIGIFAAIAIISKFIRQVKSQWKANTFYSISFAVLMFTCGLLYMIGIN